MVSLRHPPPPYALRASGGRPPCSTTASLRHPLLLYAVPGDPGEIGRNATLYIGITSDLVKRVWEHKNKVASEVTTQYNVNTFKLFRAHSSSELR